MAEFTVNPKRFDPYKNFKFRVKWDGRYVAGISKVSGLRPPTSFTIAKEAIPTAVANLQGSLNSRRSCWSAASRMIQNSRIGRTKSGAWEPLAARKFR